jgi:hypothetical protein
LHDKKVPFNRHVAGRPGAYTPHSYTAQHARLTSSQVRAALVRGALERARAGAFPLDCLTHARRCCVWRSRSSGMLPMPRAAAPEAFPCESDSKELAGGANRASARSREEQTLTGKDHAAAESHASDSDAPAVVETAGMEAAPQRCVHPCLLFSATPTLSPHALWALCASAHLLRS